MKKIILLTGIFLSTFLFQVNAQDDLSIFTENIICFPNGNEESCTIFIRIYEDIIDMINPGDQFSIRVNGPGTDLEFFTESALSSVQVINEGFYTVQIESPDGCIVSGVVEVKKCNAIRSGGNLWYIDCTGDGGIKPNPNDDPAKDNFDLDPPFVDSYDLKNSKNSFNEKFKFGYIYPNPTFGELKLDYYSENNETIKISLTGMNGFVGFITDYPIDKGEGQIEISIPTSIVNGIYSLVIYSNNEIAFAQKITISK